MITHNNVRIKRLFIKLTLYVTKDRIEQYYPINTCN